MFRLPSRGAAEFIAPEVERDVPGATAKPTRERCVLRQPGRQRSRSARQTDEDALGNLGGILGRTHLSPGGGIDEVRMSADEFSERGFVAVLSVIAEQLGGSFCSLFICAPWQQGKLPKLSLSGLLSGWKGPRCSRSLSGTILLQPEPHQ